jgi:hypothetical protein
MLADMVLEQCSAPGGSLSINLAGADAGRQAFSDAFANASEPFYFMSNATQWECGVGTLTHGTPDTLARTTVLANSSGTTSKITFVGSVYVYNTIPAAYAVHLGTFDPAYTADYHTTLMPGGDRETIGSDLVTTDGSGYATITFPVAFSAFPKIIVSNGDSLVSATPVYLFGLNASAFVVHCPSRLGGTYRVNWIAKGRA